MSDYCIDCIYYPCPDCDKDTEVFECDYKELKELDSNVQSN